MSYRAVQHGFSLVELMVAMILGLVVSFAALSIYSNATSTVRGQDAETKINDSGAFALGSLSRHIRNAGFVDWTGSPTLQSLMFTQVDNDSFRLVSPASKDLMAVAIGSGVFNADVAKSYNGVQSIHGCANGYTTPSTLTSIACQPIAGAGALLASGNHSITVSTQVRQTVDGLPTSALPTVFRLLPDGSSLQSIIASDCANRDTNATTANPQGVVAVNRFYFDAPNERILCVGNGDPTKPTVIATNIAQLVFRYGQAQPTAPAGVPSQNYSGDKMLSTLSVANETPGLTDTSGNTIPVIVWPLVTAVEICVVVVGDEGSRPAVAGSAAIFIDCNNAAVPYAAGDTRLRRAMQTTVSLRNRYRAMAS